MFDLSGQKIGQYKLIRIIGKGGMATVYQGLQESMNRPVAVKVLSATLVDDPEFSARFRREAETIANLQHPHIIPVIDFGEAGETVYLVMRLVSGGTLEREINEGPVSLLRANSLINQIASALAYAHAKGIIHRDLKPANVLLDELGNAYLTDFGIAKMLAGTTTTNMTRGGHLMGTPAYMAPEQWRSEPVDARTDGYALGVILYEMLVGLQPFEADTPYALMYNHLDKLPPSPVRYHPSLPTSVEPVIFKAISKDPKDRYASTLDMAQAVNQVVARAPNPDLRPTRPKQRFPLTPTGQRPSFEDTTAQLKVPEWIKQLASAPQESPDTPIRRERSREDVPTTEGPARSRHRSRLKPPADDDAVSVRVTSTQTEQAPRPDSRSRGCMTFLGVTGLLIFVGVIALAYMLLVHDDESSKKTGSGDVTATITETATETVTEAATEILIAPEASDTPESTETQTETQTETPSETPTWTPSPTLTPTELPTESPTATATATEEPSATPTETPEPSATTAAQIVIQPSETPTLTPSLTPSPTLTPMPSHTPTQTPSLTPTPSATATEMPTLAPSETPTLTPTLAPSETPTLTPSLTATLTAAPSATEPPDVCFASVTTSVPVNIRSGPGAGFAVSDRFLPGDLKPALLRTDTGWVYVYSGWIDDEYLAFSDTRGACDQLARISPQDSSPGQLCRIRAEEEYSDLRTDPDPAAERVYFAGQGTTLTVYRVVMGADDHLWYYGVTNDTDWHFGWMPASHATELIACPPPEGSPDAIPVTLPTPTPFPTQAEIAAAPDCQIAITINNAVNIRVGPGVNFRVSDRLLPGDVLSALLRTDTGWVYVTSGWIDGDYIRYTNAGCDTLPAISRQDPSAALLCTIRAALAESDQHDLPAMDSFRLAIIQGGTTLSVFRVVIGADGQTWYYGATNDEFWRFGWMPASHADELTVCPAGERVGG